MWKVKWDGNPNTKHALYGVLQLTINLKASEYCLWNAMQLVHYYSGGLRLNPNLYECGKVCLSLLNTWSGSKSELWTPGKSTILQVLLSIQALVLNAKPFFNEPGYASMAGSLEGEKRSIAYNEQAFLLSCRTMLYTLQRPLKVQLYMLPFIRSCIFKIVSWSL